jgi:hypothetical protein
LKLIYEDTPFVLTIKNGRVVKVFEIFVPWQICLTGAKKSGWVLIFNRTIYGNKGAIVK